MYVFARVYACVYVGEMIPSVGTKFSLCIVLWTYISMFTQFSGNIFGVSMSVIIYLLCAFIFFLELSILYLFSVLSTSVLKNTHWLTLHNQYNRSVCFLRSVGFSFPLIYLASMYIEPILNTKGNPICLQTYWYNRNYFIHHCRRLPNFSLHSSYWRMWCGMFAFMSNPIQQYDCCQWFLKLNKFNANSDLDTWYN